VGQGKFSLSRIFAVATLAAAMMLNGCKPSVDRQPVITPGEHDSAVIHHENEPTDDELLDLVQRQTLKYFTDYAHPVSGMARERTNGVEIYGKDVVTTGGTGFGIMAMIAGTSRGWLTRQETLERVAKIVDFLDTKVHTYHGAFPHYLDGATGETFEWGRNDNGGDLVETSFLMAGLLSARQYFSGDTPEEISLRAKINTLWENVDWQFYTRGENRLYWNWSPDHGWAINLPITGWNEALITYVLAAASPTHPISREVYDHGWARDGRIKDEKFYGGINLPLGPTPWGGPLFLSQYSFLGLDPRGLKDQYADYWEQIRNHTLINHAFAVLNPHHYKGYGPDWGLTSSEGPDGYNDFSPTNDQGVVAPTAALSSFPYAPELAMEELRHLYHDHGGKLWGPYGFRDSFNESRNWVANTNLAIDQGPIVVMIENYRSGLLWQLLMSSPEIKQGLEKLDFQSPYLNAEQHLKMPPHTKTMPIFTPKLI
jgi:hypothetical protein